MPKADPWGEYELSTRGWQAIRNSPWKDDPKALIKRLNEDYKETVVQMLRIPNCGRQTVDEIINELGIKRPTTGPKLSKFQTEDQLLIHMADVEIDPTLLDRPTLLLMIGLVAKGWVEKELDGWMATTGAGNNRIERLRGERRVKLVLRGKLSTINKLVESLPDDTGTKIDEHRDWPEFNEGLDSIEIELDD